MLWVPRSWAASPWVIDRTTVILSAMPAVLASFSLNCTPVSLVSIALKSPRYSSGESGLGSNVSCWAQPPGSQMWITLLAVPSKWANALASARAARIWKKPPSESPRPVSEPTWRNSRRPTPVERKEAQPVEVLLPAMRSSPAGGRAGGVADTTVPRILPQAAAGVAEPDQPHHTPPRTAPNNEPPRITSPPARARGTAGRRAIPVPGSPPRSPHPKNPSSRNKNHPACTRLPERTASRGTAGRRAIPVPGSPPRPPHPKNPSSRKKNHPACTRLPERTASRGTAGRWAIPVPGSPPNAVDFGPLSGQPPTGSLNRPSSGSPVPSRGHACSGHPALRFAR